MRYRAFFKSYFKNRPTFTIGDVRRTLSATKISDAYLHLMLHHLIKKGEIKKITRGTYTFKEDIQVVGFAYTPFYHGLQEALSLRNLWDQETNPVVITPRKVRNGIRIFLGNNYLIRRISRRMFFGFEMIRYYDFWIPVSDIEKTLIDLVYFEIKIPPEILGGIKEKIRKPVLVEYLRRVPPWVKKRVQRIIST